ncbi:MAG: hypothetical protein JKY37_28315 [Nannocystaceae bacterium]|nr:hypothetical protein [Nannocystaceae bacterium]
MTRTLRGKRRQHLLAIASVLPLLSLILGVWFTFGAGSTAHNVRRSADLEPSMETRAFAEHTIFVHSPEELGVLAMQRDVVVQAGAGFQTGFRGDNEPVPWRFGESIDNAHAAVAFAMANIDACAPAQRQRLETLAAGLDPSRFFSADTWPHGFTCSPTDVDTIARFGASGFVPTVTLYASPLSAVDLLRVFGALCGAVFGALMLLVGPLWAGAAIAQEVHEDTLQPLTGTALTARQLAVGMLAGPMVAIGIAAAPSAATFVALSLLVGNLVPALFAVALTIIVAALMATGAVLVGLSLGQRRSPGVVGVLLLTGLGAALSIGAAIGYELSNRSVGAAMVVPATSIAHFIREALLPAHALSSGHALRLGLSLLGAALGFATLAALGTIVVQRWLARDPTGLVRRHEAFVAAMTISALVLVGLWDGPRTMSELVTISAIMVAIPWLVIVMARVPAGETPAPLRVVPVVHIVGELGVVVVLHTIACGLIATEPDLHHVLGVGTLHVVWAVGVAGLIAIRLAAAPSSLATRVLLAAAAGASIAEGAMGMILLQNYWRSGNILLPLRETSVLAGVVVLALLVATPWVLLASLRKQGVTIGTPPGPR